MVFTIVKLKGRNTIQFMNSFIPIFKCTYKENIFSNFSPIIFLVSPRLYEPQDTILYFV